MRYEMIKGDTMSIAGTIISNKKEDEKRVILSGYPRRIVAKITEHSWHGQTNYYTLIEFTDGSIMVLDFDIDSQEPNPPMWIYEEEIYGVYEKLEEVEKESKNWNFEELETPIFTRITGTNYEDSDQRATTGGI